jgi:hypothetical protein
LDYDTAFLNATLSNKVYIILPAGCGKHSGKIWLLNKALYGLCQAPLEWFDEIHGSVIQLGYVATTADPCIFVKKQDGYSPIILCLYVDDTIVCYDKQCESTWLADKAKLQSKYKIKDLGDCNWILNMKVTRNRTVGTLQTNVI